MPSIGIIVGALATLVVVLAAGFFVVTGNDGPQAPLALVDAEPAVTVPAKPATIQEFCSNPRPIADAPLPSATLGNVFEFYKWENGRSDYFRFNVGAFNLVAFNASNRFGSVDLPEMASADAAYIGCVKFESNGEKLTCTGYGERTSLKLWGHYAEVDVYELATAELIRSFDLDDTDFPTCPEMTDGSSEFQGISPSDLQQAVVDLAVPLGGTLPDARNEIEAQDDWCGNPSPISALVGGADLLPEPDPEGDRPVEPETDVEPSDEEFPDPVQVMFAGFESQTVPETQSPAILAEALNTLDYVVCLSFTIAEVDPLAVCEYGSTDGFSRLLSYDIEYGQFTAVAIDPATAEVVATSNFESSLWCDAVLLAPKISPVRATVDPALFDWLGALPN